MYEWNFLKRKRKAQFYSRFVKEGDRCIDVGAHLGDRSSTWMQLGANVIAVDPQPTYFKYLTKKFSGNSKVHVENIALSNEAGQMELHVSHKHPTVSSLSSSEWRAGLIKASDSEVIYDESILVETNTLDYLISKYGKTNFIKIDVEGFEHQVLSGLTEAVDYISFEFLSFDRSNMNLCLDYLEGLGYQEFNWSYAETFKFDSKSWISRLDLEQRIDKFDKSSFSGDIYAKI